MMKYESVPMAGEEVSASVCIPGIDSGLLALILMSSLHGIAADIEQLRHVHGHAPFTDQSIILAARALGMKARVVVQSKERLTFSPVPAIGVDRAGQYFILAKFEVVDKAATHVLIQRPLEPPTILAIKDFMALWDGRLILFTSKANFIGEAARFDFTWFIPAVVKYRRMLAEILAISLVLQLIGLATPLFFQVVMDKVLVNQAMKTLNIIAIGLICANMFEVVLTAIRTYAFSHTSSKIDVELGARLFQHLLNLPMAYFEARKVGDSVARIRELENIRTFLTSNAMTLLLDVGFSFVYLAVMLWYSPWLTLIVIVSIPAYVALSMIFTPILRLRLNEKFNRNSENQAFLVESISGIGTIKAMAGEPRWQQRWEKQLAAYVTESLAANNVATIANGGVSLVTKLVTAGIMWLGATLVIDSKMTVGELIAFNMLAGQISSPILRLAQLWNDFQQVGIAMSRLGDVLNTRTESSGNKTCIPRIEGTIEFDHVSFRYRPDTAEVIRDLCLRVVTGEIIGIVGRSGSGKSTLTKLLQRLHLPDRGRVLIDSQDLAIIDAASLRQQIGVVLQESTLFARSIRDNIAISNPALPLAQVIAAAKLAGAHDFICELPHGYDTQVGEHGVGLSGGQRQRIAIARALITNPRILIFDEATSALDYESEKIIQDNMRRICAGRTVLIIAHRLSAVRNADRIVVMEKGQIAEVGSHDELLANHEGIYTHLHGLQHSPGGLNQQNTSAQPASAAADWAGSATTIPS